MSIVNKLKSLKTNIFGGKGNTGFTKPPASTIQDIDLQSSPTGLLETDPLSFSTLSYPYDVQTSFQNGHYMLFYVNVQDKSKYEYEINDLQKVSSLGKGESNSEKRYRELKKLRRNVYKAEGKGGTGQVYEDPDDAMLGTSDYFGGSTTSTSTKKGVSSAFNDTRRISDSVSLYLPPSVEDTTTAGYTDAATGIAGFLVASGIDVQGKDAAAIAKSISGAGKALLQDATYKSIGVVAELAGAEGADKLAKKAFGEADNPYMEVLFDAMQLRTFTYNFQFAPRSEDEAIEVQRIIQLFRFHMAPELRPGVNRYLGLPSQFDIHYMFLSRDGVASENNFYNRIATCVLQDCKVNYTPNGVKSFEDGGPTATTMTLTFKEIELLTKDKIAEGF